MSNLKLKKNTMKFVYSALLFVVVYLNLDHIIAEALHGGLIYQVPVATLLAYLFFRFIEETDHTLKLKAESALILVGYISSYILIGLQQGMNNYSFHILHALLIMGAYHLKRYRLGNGLTLLSLFAVLLMTRLQSIDTNTIILYIGILVSVFTHLIHIRTIVKSKKDLHQKIDELETLYAITKVMDSFPDLQNVLKQITRIITYGIGVDVCAVMLYSQETGELELEARYPDTVMKYSISPESGLAGEVFRTGRPIVCGDLNQNMDLLERVRFKNEENALGIFPLEHQGNRFGVLLFSNKSPLNMDLNKEEVMYAVASTVSMVIGSALYHETLAKSAQMDDLTGLYNRSYFYDSLEREIRKAKFTGQRVYVLVLDIDKFKTFNDTYGHLTGDRILENIGRIISENTRKTDVAARYGGEEFALILPNSCYSAAEHLAERIRRSVEKLTLEIECVENIRDQVTMSVGIACYPHCAKATDQLVDVADKRMYAAKRTGGNQYIYE
ncbi:diguanylate cyclase [Fusibacter sp. JL216-2]|uniref:diguanylate cyclase n=1 Tax=Fusibacter sp. JL216-2 TaxID=3071453 RepID=UPI003D336BF7